MRGMLKEELIIFRDLLREVSIGEVEDDGCLVVN